LVSASKKPYRSISSKFCKCTAACLFNLTNFGECQVEVFHGGFMIVKSFFQAIIHPDTGEKIPMPFRMSGFVPFGTPIVVGLLLPSQTLASTTFWQWLNQSHNACVNYCNRNATQVSEDELDTSGMSKWLMIGLLGVLWAELWGSGNYRIYFKICHVPFQCHVKIVFFIWVSFTQYVGECNMQFLHFVVLYFHACCSFFFQQTSMKDFGFGYVGAVTTAVSIALGLNVALKKATALNPVTRALIQRFIPFPAVGEFLCHLNFCARIVSSNKFYC